MIIKEAMEVHELPFDHPWQSARGKLTHALQRLNGAVLPVIMEAGEQPEGVRQAIYYAATKAGINVATTKVEGTFYVRRATAPATTENV